MWSARWLLVAGIILVLVGAILYGGGFAYGLRFAYRPEEMRGWLDLVFPAALVVGGLGLLLLAASFVQWLRRGR
jgi:hypothetical protein